MSEKHSSQAPRLRGVIYSRKSNQDDGMSIEQQEEWADRACSEAGIDVPQEARFRDQAKAGHETKKRSAFLAMLCYCQEQERKGQPVDVIVCWHTNRFSRETSIKTARYLDEFLEAGVYRMFTHARWIDFRRMEDRVLFNIEQDASNNAYSRNLAADAARGRARVAREGQHNGGKPPYGYRIEHRTEKVKGKWRRVPSAYIIVPELAEIVRVELFEAYASTDTSTGAIARKLNRLKVPGPEGGPWTAVAVGRILRNRKYLGDMPFGDRVEGKFWFIVDAELTVGEQDQPGKKRKKDADKVFVFRGSHPPIVDLDLFETCQARRRARRKGAPGGEHGASNTRSGDRTHLLSDLLVCGHCGEKMMFRGQPSRAKATRGAIRPTYVCSTYWNDASKACTHNQVGEEAFVEVLSRKLREALSDPERIARLREIVRDQEGEAAADADPNEQVRNLEQQVKELEARIKRGVERTLAEEDEELAAAYRAQVQEWQQERGRLLAAREALQRSSAASAGERVSLDERVAEALAVVERVQLLLEAGEPARVRALLQELIAKVVLFFGRKQVGKEVRSPFVRGLLYIRPDALLGTSVTDSDPATGSALQVCNAALVISFTAADLKAA